MSDKRVIISGRACATAIVAEIIFLMLVTWVYAGMPGFQRDAGPAMVTIQFGPLAPPSLARSHQI